MEPGSSENETATASEPAAQLVTRRKPAIPVAVILRDLGALPPALDPRGRMLDPSPFRGLSPSARRRRLVGILELAAAHGDTAAANAALVHARWEEEMRKGRAPQRIDLAASGEIRVIDTLSAPPGTPIPLRSPRPTRSRVG